MIGPRSANARRTDVDEARAAGNLLVTAREVHERGVGWVLDQLLPDASIFVSLDFDGLDPSVFPAVSAQAPGGLSPAEAAELVGAIGPRLAGAVVTEYVPSLDESGASAAVAVRLLVHLMAALG